MKKIAFIGLGIMGKPMAKNLMKAGYPLVVYDLSQEAVTLLAEAGAAAASSIAATVQDVDIIITMLPNSPEVRAVALSEDGLIAHARAGSLLIDMSSIAPLASQEIATALRTRHIRMIDAPVSGGEPKAIDGTLSIMCGGSEEDFAEAKPILICMGASVVHVGGIGAGNTTKLANQIIVACNIAAVAEAFTLAVKAGVDPGLVFEAIRGGLAGSTVMNAKVPMMLAGNAKPGFKIDLHIKDLRNALETASAFDSPTPLTHEALMILQDLHDRGEGQNDHSAIAHYYERLAGIKIRKKDDVL
jgi:2-hydroxy-3-oxopropionate reductase